MPAAIYYPTLIGIFEDGSTPRTAIPTVDQSIDNVAGQTINYPFAITNPSGSPTNLSSASVVFTVRDRNRNLLISRQATLTDAVNGKGFIPLSIGDTAVAAMPIDTYKYDLVIKWSDTDVAAVVSNQLFRNNESEYVDGTPVTVPPTQLPFAQPATAPINLYVSPTGDDLSGDGTSGHPFATITRALEALPVLGWTQTAQINLTPGTHAPFGGTINGGPLVGPDAAPIQITGVPAQLLAPVTSTGGSLTTLVTSGLVSGALRGACLRMITGPNAGGLYTIFDNTTTTITIHTAGFSGGSEAAGGSQFAVDVMPVIPIGALGPVLFIADAVLSNFVLRGDGADEATILLDRGAHVSCTSVEIDCAGNGEVFLEDGILAGAFGASLYVHDTSESEGLVAKWRCVVEQSLMLRNVDVYVAGGVLDLETLTAVGSSINLVGARFFYGTSGLQGNTFFHGSLSGGGIASKGTVVVSDGSVAALALLDVSSSIANGVYADGRSLVSLASCTGVGNAGVGVDVTDGARGDLTSCTTTGATGDVAVQGVVYPYATLISAGGATDTLHLTRVEAA